MKTNYETLGESLDALDRIKEKVAEETEAMNARQVKTYFAAAARALQEATGESLRVRRERPKSSATKR